MLDDPASTKGSIRHVRRLRSRNAGCVRVFDGAESSHTKLGCLSVAIVKEHIVPQAVLDTRTGDPSQQLYEKIGYILAGIIPHYARGTTGILEPTSIMYKEIKEVSHHAT